MAYVAAAALTEDDRYGAAACWRRLLETARAGRQLAQAAVQLHGGMGMTDELEVGDYFKRLTVADQLLGDSAEQLAVLALAREEEEHERCGGRWQRRGRICADPFSLRQGVGRITLNRPERLNNFTEAMHAELARALDALEACEGLRGLIVTGAGRGFAPARTSPNASRPLPASVAT